MTTDHPTLSVVAPCFNEEGVLHELYRRISQVLDGSGETWELVLVNDGSRDRTPEIMRELHAQDDRVKVVDFARNFGHQIAVTAGMDYARGDAVVLIDADLQDPPELILEMLAKWREGYEVVYAIRAERKGETWFKEFTAKMFYRIIYKITDIDIPMDTGDFRLMDRKVVNALKTMHEKHRFMRGMSVWVGFRQTGVKYVRAERYAGETKYPLKKMLEVRDGRDHLVLLFSAPACHLHRIHRRSARGPGHPYYDHLAPVGQPRVLGSGDHPGQCVVPGRRAVDLPGHPR